MYRTRNCIELNKELAGQKVKLAGWVDTRRDHGKLIFIDLRDRSGLVQVVFIPKKEGDNEFYKKAESLRAEFVVSISGKVNLRPKGMINPKMSTGEIEIEAEDLKILNEAKTPPFEITTDKEINPAHKVSSTFKLSKTGQVICGINEEIRLKYRYLDLRRQKMKENLHLRHQMIKFFRDFLAAKGFWEIETPYITKGTPEGAREFVIPSRLHQGKFYVLPQAPQQFKQLLMVAGIEKYFQIARCFRDEDPRSDRQAEFTQLDMEMSFIVEEDIINLIEEMMIEMIKNVAPEKKITQVPFPRIPYTEAIKKYKSDKPDIRENKDDPNELGFCFVVDFPLFEYSETDKCLVAKHNPFTMPKVKDIPLLDKHPEKVLGQQYDFVCNGFETAGGAIRIHKPELQKKVFKILGLTDKQIKEKFSHMLEAFEYGAPPHGGIAPGIDRLAMILAGETSIREIIAFPKTGDGRDLMMGAPSDIDEKQLKELHIRIEE